VGLKLASVTAYMYTVVPSINQERGLKGKFKDDVEWLKGKVNIDILNKKNYFIYFLIKFSF
jgi:hypothetical protein